MKKIFLLLLVVFASGCQSNEVTKDVTSEYILPEHLSHLKIEKIAPQPNAFLPVLYVVSDGEKVKSITRKKAKEKPITIILENDK